MSVFSTVWELKTLWREIWPSSFLESCSRWSMPNINLNIENKIPLDCWKFQISWQTWTLGQMNYIFKFGRKRWKTLQSIKH